MDNKTDAPVPMPPFIVRPDAQLVMLVGCATCRSPSCLVGVVVPGFVFACKGCGVEVERGCVIACAQCGTAVCAACVYETHLRNRVAALTGD